jgi:hypothetical protein
MELLPEVLFALVVCFNTRSFGPDRLKIRGVSSEAASASDLQTGLQFGVHPPLF